LGQASDFLDGEKKVSTFDTDNGAHDRRVRIVAESRDQVLDASNPVTAGVEDRAVQERREVKNVSHGKPLQPS
jgi:hypothetical protein